MRNPRPPSYGAERIFYIQNGWMDGENILSNMFEPVSVDELTCQECGSEHITTWDDHADMSFTILCNGCGRNESYTERERMEIIEESMEYARQG